MTPPRGAVRILSRQDRRSAYQRGGKNVSPLLVAATVQQCRCGDLSGFLNSGSSEGTYVSLKLIHTEFIYSEEIIGRIKIIYSILGIYSEVYKKYSETGNIFRGKKK
jgi:hypothetical protein